VRSWSSDKGADNGHDWDPTVASLAQRIDDSIAGALDNRSLADLIDQDRAAEPENPTAPQR
jgi:hypothetical protein